MKSESKAVSFLALLSIGWLIFLAESVLLMLVIGGLNHEVSSDIPAVSLFGAMLTITFFQLLSLAMAPLRGPVKVCKK